MLFTTILPTTVAVTHITTDGIYHRTRLPLAPDAETRATTDVLARVKADELQAQAKLQQQ